jgi:hypothetical protein
VWKDEKDVKKNERNTGMLVDNIHHSAKMATLPKESLPLDAPRPAPTTVSKELLIDRREE